MRHLRACCAAATLLATGCGSDMIAGIADGGFAGEWTLVAWFLESRTDPERSIDVFNGPEPHRAQLSVGDRGHTVLVVRILSEDGVEYVGRTEVSGEVGKLELPTYGDGFTLRGRRDGTAWNLATADVEVDFDGDAVDEPAILRWRFEPVE